MKTTKKAKTAKTPKASKPKAPKVSELFEILIDNSMGLLEETLPDPQAAKLSGRRNGSRPMACEARSRSRRRASSRAPST